MTKNGHTYVSDGSIYFKISTLPDYGKLAHLDHDGMKPGARVDSDNYAKDDAARLRAVESHQARRADLERRRSARAARAGTSSARRWRCACSANRRSTFTAAAST